MHTNEGLVMCRTAYQAELAGADPDPNVITC